MKKQIRTLVILLGVAVLLVAGIFGAKWITEKSEETEATEAKQTVFDIDSAKITEISWEYEGLEPLTLMKKEDGTWALSDEPDTALNSTKVSSVLAGISKIPVDRELTANGTDEDYGFTEPTNRVKVTADGEIYEFVFGKKNSLETMYYMQYDGHIYMTELFECSVFNKKRTEFYEEQPETEGSGTYAAAESETEKTETDSTETEETSAPGSED